MKPAGLLAIAALLAPPERRAEWLDEWHSELWYVLKPGVRNEWEVLRFCLGAFTDAWWVRRAQPADRPWMRSPVFCLIALFAVAAATAVPFARFLLHGVSAMVIGNSRNFVVGEGVVFLSALAVLPSVTPFGQGRFIEASDLYDRRARWRERLFLALKLVLTWSIVFCGTCDAAFCYGALGIQPHTAFLGHVILFRWVLNDQRSRCPVCLRTLSTTRHVGKASRTFLERYGAESGCERRHGVMYTPEVITNYTTAMWRDRDMPGSLSSLGQP